MTTWKARLVIDTDRERQSRQPSAAQVLRDLLWLASPTDGGWVRLLLSPAQLDEMREALEELEKA